MQFFYDEKMPLRILDEGEFWKHQEAEHTTVIRALVANLEHQFVTALKAWEQSFSKTHGLFVQYIEMVVRSGHQVSSENMSNILELIHFSIKESEEFIELLNQLAAESKAIRNNTTAITVLNHIRRESEYFIGISKAFLSQTP